METPVGKSYSIANRSSDIGFLLSIISPISSADPTSTRATFDSSTSWLPLRATQEQVKKALFHAAADRHLSGCHCKTTADLIRSSGTPPFLISMMPISAAVPALELTLTYQIFRRLNRSWHLANRRRETGRLCYRFYLVTWHGGVDRRLDPTGLWRLREDYAPNPVSRPTD